MTFITASELLKKQKQEDKERLEKAKDARAVVIALGRELKKFRKKQEQEVENGRK